jgi:hypothetical protein
MATNLEILTDENIEIIRQRHFDLDSDDDSRDSEIDEMTKEEVCACLIGWELGSDSWLDQFIMYVSEATGRDEEDIKVLLFETNDEE